jgi:lipoprotein NlpD
MVNYRFKFLIILFFTYVLVACAPRKTPAPVVSITTIIHNPGVGKKSISSNNYSVTKGETLYSIAWRSDIDVRELAAINKIKPPYKIFPGQLLSLKKPVRQGVASSSSARTSQSLNKSSGLTSTQLNKKPIEVQKKQEYVGTKTEQKVISKQSVTEVGLQGFSTKVDHWQWPSRGKVISYFSSKPQGNKGVDISGRRGDAIQAAAAGKVVYAGNALRGYGNLIIVKHNDDYLSAYAHNDKLLVKEQDIVKAGQKIALMGSTGTERVMLHFEIRFRGKSVNPTRYLPKR